MAITGYMESTLSQSEIFQGLNSMEGAENVTQKAVNLIKTAKRLSNQDIEASYIAVRQITDTLTTEAIKAFDEERIVLLYNNNPQLSVSQACPFLTFKNKDGQYTTYIFMDKYITINRDGVTTCKSTDLRDLLIGALIANGLKTNYNVMASNQYLQKLLMDIYTKFIIRILNREYSIIADKVVFDTIQYWINKFFLLRVMGATDSSENLDKISAAHFKYIDEMKYAEIKQTYDEADPANISGLLELLQTASPRMKTLNKLKFLSNWINYYYAPATLAIDNIEYLIFMCLTMLSGNNNIISIAASDIVKDAKNIKSFRSELLKLI